MKKGGFLLLLTLLQPIKFSVNLFPHLQIHNNGVFGQDGLKVPQAIEENLQLVKKFLNEVHGYSEWILSTLSKALALPYDLKDCHRKDKPSSANLAMLKYLPYGSGDEKVGNMAHTDLGTLSIIFSQIGGLQVMLPESEEWGFVEPRAGHAVVIVGDSLRFLSNYVLRSCLHRVVPPPNATGQYKFSLVYNLRPEFDAKFTAYGRRTNSLDWHNQKYALFREAGLDPERHFAMLTGRETYTGLAGQ
jgi:isopenicillin N synthase-like dioxygenase